MNVKFDREGDWDFALKRMQQLGMSINTASGTAQRDLARELYAIVVGHLLNQDIPGWTKLSERYKRRKREHGYQDDILIRTGQYLAAIEVYKEGKNWFTGVKQNRFYENGTPIADVALAHEIWSTLPGRPHRPLWGPSIKELFGTKKASGIMITRFITHLRKMGYPVTRISY